MYNRYTPQSDGTLLRRSIPEETPKPPPVPHPVPPPQAPPVSQEPPKQRPIPHREPENVLSFLKGLLPQGFDTGDLLVVLLLLLMSGERPEAHNTALLTLVLYLFL